MFDDPSPEANEDSSLVVARLFAITEADEEEDDVDFVELDDEDFRLSLFE
jgi:hypothetical protein